MLIVKNLVNPVGDFPGRPLAALRLIFLDFPIFLDLNGSLPIVKSPNT